MWVTGGGLELGKLLLLAASLPSWAELVRKGSYSYSTGVSNHMHEQSVAERVSGESDSAESARLVQPEITATQHQR